MTAVIRGMSIGIFDAGSREQVDILHFFDNHDVLTAFTYTCIFAMYPNTLNMTKPATKLVTQLMVLVMMASL